MKAQVVIYCDSTADRKRFDCIIREEEGEGKGKGMEGKERKETCCAVGEEAEEERERGTEGRENFEEPGDTERRERKERKNVCVRETEKKNS